MRLSLISSSIICLSILISCVSIHDTSPSSEAPMIKQSGSISGVVLGTGNQPLPDVAVMLVDAPGTFQDVAALTDSQGKFSFLDLRPGNYRLKATTDTLGFREVTLIVEGDKATSVTISFAENSQ